MDQSNDLVSYNESLIRIIDMNHRLASFMSKIDINSERFLNDSILFYLKEACNSLRFDQGEIYLLFDEKGNLPNMGEAKKNWHTIRPVASVGFEGAEQDDEKYVYNRSDFKHGGSIACALEGKVIQYCKNKKYIKRLERLGIFRPLYWEEVIENYQGPDNRNVIIPITRHAVDFTEVPGFANFSKPNYDIPDSKLISKRDIKLARHAIDQISPLIISCGLINDRNNALVSLRKSVEERERLAGLAQIGIFAGEISHTLRNHGTKVKQNLELAGQYLRRNNKETALQKILLCLAANEKLTGLTERFSYIAHPNTDFKFADIHNSLESILLMEKSAQEPVRLKDSVEIERSQPISLVKDFDYGLPEVYHNVSAMSQVYVHLMSNSVRAVRSRAQNASARNIQYSPEIKVSTRIQDNKALIIFRDNGIGIKNDDLKLVFDISFTTKPQSMGVGGYGLAYTYKIVKEHQGDIRIKSQENEFTEITLELPISQSDVQEP